MTSSRNFGNLKELLQLEAIGTSVGSNHYRVLLPALPCARLVLYCHSAHINYLSKPSNAMQVFFTDSNLFSETMGEVSWSETQTQAAIVRRLVQNSKRVTTAQGDK